MDNKVDLITKLKEKGVKQALISFVGINGISRAKLVPVDFLDDALQGGATFTGYAVGDLGFKPEDPDFSAIPDLSSMVILPWKKDTAWFTSDIYVNGKLWPFAPRNIAKTYLTKLKQEKGHVMQLGIELEFFVVKKVNNKIEPADPNDLLERPCYDAQTLIRSNNLGLIEELLYYFNEVLGWKAYAVDHEDANGQYEIDTQHTEALTQSDRHIFSRFMIRSVAEKRGLIATFMPKPFNNLTGNGAHFNLSLWKDDENLFYDPNDELGFSQFGRYFLGGLLYHARSLMAIVMPTVNSYKRLHAITPRSGARWVSAYAVYSVNNKTSMIRLPYVNKAKDDTRIEFRSPDGLVNPYLAVVAILAAGLDGVNKKIEPGSPIINGLSDNKELKQLPADLREALLELQNDDVLKSALGKDFVDNYVDLKMSEWREYAYQVTEWDYNKYLNWA
ncbi:type III glutamate--ammonia ligase [Sulfurisphaera ohwakuensis]|uniref:Glutamine synthetase n=1 Tax=Sulfurisphaera ohwakuensis TaxID=69656 RepID=A0A650CG77_SULOH|nr:type III glutamate--ammonia ligase [Sulfurisphaera ohwakuensis]MBB5255142.1 glutamine synthetase [Sulfurisphaera ohwakuensis]QGR16780.1 type III glutamate--ammonia ligase [Sulfurisphaera ohwakuensis]